MPSAIRAGEFLSLLLAFLLLFAGCATIGSEPAEKVTYTSRDATVKVSPRERNATVTREAPERLANQGYAELGTLTVTYTKERCFGNDCDRTSHSETPTERLLHEAAKRGADVVILSQDNVAARQSVTRRGSCLRNEVVSTSVPYTKCDSRTVCDRSGFCRSEQTNCRTEYRSGLQQMCAAYHTEFGNETAVESVGIVWRYDPDLAKSAAQRNEPLVAAAELGQLTVVRALIEKGADANAGSARGTTALAEAARQGHTEIVNLLLDSGAHVDAKGTAGITALMIAATLGRTETVKTLLAGGADVNAKDKDGYSVLSYAATWNEHPETVKALLTAGADLNARSRRGGTPLMHAASKGRTEIVRLLLARGADLNWKDNEGLTALAHAEKGRHTAVIEMLRRAGAAR